MTVALVFIYLAIGFYVWRASYKSSVGALLLVYLATPIGVYLDFYIHRLVWDYDRGVWLFETVVFWMLAFVPLVAGALIAKITGSRKRRARPAAVSGLDNLHKV